MDKPKDEPVDKSQADEGVSLEEVDNPSKAYDLADLIEDHGDDPAYFEMCARSLLGPDWPVEGAVLIRHVALDGRGAEHAVNLIDKFRALLDKTSQPHANH